MICKKRRKSRRAKRGTYFSLKMNKEFKYRSSWEMTYMQHLDLNPLVTSYEYEPFFIEYVSNLRSKRVRKYYPDFFVEMSDGTKHLIEVKPKRKILKSIIIKKMNAAIEWCKKNDVKFSFVTENEINIFKKEQQ